MAGHSHWARIKRAKAVTDKRRSKEWSKLSRAIIVAARAGGGDPDMNLSLRYAIDAAKAANMPRDTIERAVKKGAGGLDTEQYHELIYEGFGPGGAAILAQVLTDNRNRTAPEIKKIFEINGGNLGATGSVAWQFEKRGVLIVSSADAGDGKRQATSAEPLTEERVTEIALEAGADDVQPAGAADDGAGASFEVRCDPGVLSAVRQAYETAGVKVESAEISMIAANTVQLTGEPAEKIMKLVDALEDHDDIQKVFSNFELSEADMTRLAGE